MAKILSADANYAAVESYSGLYLASGIKTTVQIHNKTWSKVSRKRQGTIICLSHRGGDFWYLSYEMNMCSCMLLQPSFWGKTGEVGWAEKLALKEL